MFSFLLLRPSKTSEALKKGPNFGFLTCLNKLGIGWGLYGKSVLYLLVICLKTPLRNIKMAPYVELLQLLTL